MRVLEAEITIEVKREDLDLIGYSLYYDLRNSIENHYNRLQGERDGEPIFNEQEGRKIRLMQDALSLIGHRDIAESFLREFKRSFSDKREEREKKK
jgi:hypothetical protein